MRKIAEIAGTRLFKAVVHTLIDTWHPWLPSTKAAKARLRRRMPDESLSPDALAWLDETARLLSQPVLDAMAAARAASDSSLASVVVPHPGFVLPDDPVKLQCVSASMTYLALLGGWKINDMHFDDLLDPRLRAAGVSAGDSSVGDLLAEALRGASNDAQRRAASVRGAAGGATANDDLNKRIANVLADNPGAKPSVIALKLKSAIRREMKAAKYQEDRKAMEDLLIHIEGKKEAIRQRIKNQMSAQK